MIFQALTDAAAREELILIDGGICHWHLRKDGQLTIREIISTRRGAGSEMLGQLKQTVGARTIFAKCPAELPANDWYKKQGFTLLGTETTRTGRTLKLWELQLSSTVHQETRA